VLCQILDCFQATRRTSSGCADRLSGCGRQRQSILALILAATGAADKGALMRDSASIDAGFRSIDAIDAVGLHQWTGYLHQSTPP
jgi:hypothetical protein